MTPSPDVVRRVAAFLLERDEAIRGDDLDQGEREASAEAILELVGDDRERCEICDAPLKPDDLCLTDITLGIVHAACCGPESEGYVNLETGEPIGPDEALPTPYRYDSLPQPKSTAPQPPKASVDEVRERLSRAFGEPIHIEPRDYLEKVLAGLFRRQPDMSGDQRKRLHDTELRSVQRIADAILSALSSVDEPAGEVEPVAWRYRYVYAAQPAGKWTVRQTPIHSQPQNGFWAAIEAQPLYARPHPEQTGGVVG